MRLNFFKSLFRMYGCKQLAKCNSTAVQIGDIHATWNRLIMGKNQQLLQQEHTLKLGQILTRGNILKPKTLLSSVQMFCNNKGVTMKQIQTAAYSTATTCESRPISIEMKYPRITPMITTRDNKSTTSPIANKSDRTKLSYSRRQMRPVYLSHLGRRRYLRLRCRRRCLVAATLSRRRNVKNSNYGQSKQLYPRTTVQLSVVEQLQQMLTEAMRGVDSTKANAQITSPKRPVSPQSQYKNNRKASSLSLLLPAFRPKRKSLRRNMRM